MKIAIKLFFIISLLTSSFSTFADGYLRTDSETSEWVDDFGSVLKAHHIAVTEGDAHLNRTYHVSGYQLCHGVFLFQSVVNGQRHDLIFENKQLAEEFKSVVEHYRSVGPNGRGKKVFVSNIWPGWGVWKVAAVGYKTEQVINKEKKEVIQLLYLNHDGYTPQNYACKNVPTYTKDIRLAQTVHRPMPF